MKVTVPSNEGTFELAPDGTHPAVLVDVIDLGKVEVDEYGKPGVKKVQHQVKLAFQIAENMTTGKPFLVSTWGMLLSMDPKAKLRKIAETLNGRPFAVGEDVDLDSLIGCNCLLEVVHKKNTDGTKTYANIGNIARAMKGMAVLQPRDYVRVQDRPKGGEPNDDIANPNFDDNDASIPF